MMSLGSPTFVEVAPRSSPTAAQEPLVVWISGDGGWGRMEKEVTRRLAAQGAPTLGVNALRYFARQRQPAQAAQTIAREIRQYDAAHGKRDIVLVGFSFGADMGPLIVHDLPDDVRSRIRLAAFLSPSERANLQVSPASWLGIGTGPRVWPALSTLAPIPVLCVGGAGVFHDICPLNTRSVNFVSVRLEGGHQLEDHYDLIAQLLLADPQMSKTNARAARVAALIKSVSKSELNH